VGHVVSEDNGCSASENRLLRIFGLRREKVTLPGADSIVKSIVTFTLHEILLGS
jgi:hypothetical protein